MSNTPIQTEALAQLRTRIDALDNQLLALLNERARVAEEVGALKRQEGTPFFRPDRVAQVIAKVQRANPGPLLNQHVAAIWREVMSACLALEVPQRVAVLGPEGTFTEQAAVEFFGSAANLIYCQSFDEVFHATAAGTAQFGVVAVENSTEGVVARSFDLFLHSPVHIIGEVSLLVRHNLLRRTAGLDGIEVVMAHPQALMQCQNWLSQHLPHAERRAVSSNAEGARLTADNPAWASLASERAAAQFGLHIVAHAVQDEAYNRTRFAVVCLPQTLSMPVPTGRDCTSIVVSVPNKPGSVHDMLTPLKKHGVSMTRFESRPAKSGQWEYYFYIDIAGHPSEPHIDAALGELRQLCAFYKVLGAYPWETMFEQLGLIGCGLMGGSFALALKRAGLVRRVVGYSKSPSTTERARQLGVIDIEAPSALQAVSGSDLVLLAVPVAATEATFKSIRHLLTPEMLVIDVGSTKRDVVDAARRTLKTGVGSFVPCHPITGREVAGVENADADLYHGKQVILTPIERTLTRKIEQATALWKALGCRVFSMSPESHDAAFAAVSHLPHLIAFALMNSLTGQPHGKDYLSLAGPGFRDFSRIAASDPQVWRDVLIANREELAAQTRHFQQALAQFEQLIAAGQADALEQLITQASHSRATWRVAPGAQ